MTFYRHIECINLCEVYFEYESNLFLLQLRVIRLRNTINCFTDLNMI
jgi:hypothetical protein